MKEFVAEGYQVVESYDRDSHIVAYASSKCVADAIAASKNKAYRHVSPFKQKIIVFDTLPEYEQHQVHMARSAALAKLTLAERKLLGLEI